MEEQKQVFESERKKEEKMSGSVFVKAEEVAKELGISKALAYRMIRNWNEELKRKGFTTVQGRVSRKYYQERVYGLSELKQEEFGASM